MAKEKDKINNLTPDQIRERGRQLLLLATQKEKEIKNRQLLQLGGIFHREIESGWASEWIQLAKELEAILGAPVTPPTWNTADGAQSGGSAPLAVKHDSEVLDHQEEDEDNA